MPPQLQTCLQQLHDPKPQTLRWHNPQPQVLPDATPSTPKSVTQCQRLLPNLNTLHAALYSTECVTSSNLENLQEEPPTETQTRYTTVGKPLKQ